MTIRHEDDIRITREAADWFMELQTEGPSCHADFAQWLRRSPEHVEEFLAISGVSRKLDGIDPQRRIDVQELLTDHGAPIAHLTPAVERGRASTREPATAHWLSRRRKIWKSWNIGLAAACVAAGALVIFHWLAPGQEIYATGIGEQRAFKLPDGSLIHLNTQSRAELRFSAGAREVRLLDGEALFVVERDPVRPFRVLSGATTVQALGTQFNVYRLPGGSTTVSVVEGAVQVTAQQLETKDLPGPDKLAAGDIRNVGASTRLDAGEQADIRNGRVEKHAVADVESVTAWRQRRLVFRDKPLAEVVAEFNRYNSLQLEVEAAAGEEPLSGVFAADRPESLALFLERDKSVRVERHGDRLIIHSSRAQP